MSYLVLSGSLYPESRSRILAEKAVALLQTQAVPVEYVDLREFPLPLCDGDKSQINLNVLKLKSIIARAQGILLAGPVYNYAVNSALKNAVELTGEVWNDKVIGFLIAAGGKNSYMSFMSFGNSLMLEFRCTIIPRFVYSTADDFNGENLPSAELQRRLKELTTGLIRYTKALRKNQINS